MQPCFPALGRGVILPTMAPARSPLLHQAPVDASTSFRRLVLALVVIGALGLLTELLLIEHFEDAWQWAPLASLTATVLASAAVAWRPSPATLRTFQVVMAACVIFGVVGVVLHLKGNMEFELEGAPELRGWPLYRETIMGATPALAPGALAQLGLLGLLFSYRHPAGTAPAVNRNASGTQEQS